MIKCPALPSHLARATRLCHELCNFVAWRVWRAAEQCVMAARPQLRQLVIGRSHSSFWRTTIATMVAVVSTVSGSAAAMEEAPKLLWLWTVMQLWDSCSHCIDTLRVLVEAVQAWSIEYQEVVYDVVESAINAVSDTRALANFLARALSQTAA